MKKTVIKPKSFHIWEERNDDSEYDCKPRHGLEYQHDYINETHYSIVRADDIRLIQNQAANNVPIDFLSLLHFTDKDLVTVDYLLRLNNFRYGWLQPALMVFVARVQMFEFGNMMLGMLLFLHLFKQGMSVKQVYSEIAATDEFWLDEMEEDGEFDMMKFLRKFKNKASKLSKE